MTVGGVVLVICAGGLLAGCSGPTHPPFQDLTGDHAGSRATGGGSTGDEPDGDVGGSTGAGGNDDPAVTPLPDGGPFDSSQAYLLSLLSGTGTQYAVAPATNPALYSYGFEQKIVGNAAIRGGELYYQDDDERPIRIFLPDVVGQPAPSELPASGAQSNDAVVSSPKCVGDVAKNQGPFTFLVGSTGQFIYECYYGGSWYEGDASVFEVGLDRTLLALGTANRGLVYRAISDRFYIVTLRTKNEVAVDTDFPVPYLAIHSHGSGFHVAASADSAVDLWDVTADGAVAKIGSYQLESGFTISSAALTAADELVALGYSGARRSVKRYVTMTSTSDTLYTEESGTPLDTLDARLITGP